LPKFRQICQNLPKFRQIKIKFSRLPKRIFHLRECAKMTFSLFAGFHIFVESTKKQDSPAGRKPTHCSTHCSTKASVMSIFKIARKNGGVVHTCCLCPKSRQIESGQLV
jgi:hypothetical protein